MSNFIKILGKDSRPYIINLDCVASFIPYENVMGVETFGVEVRLKNGDYFSIVTNDIAHNAEIMRDISKKVL